MKFEDLIKLFEDFSGTAFRLETLGKYTVEGEQEDFRRFLSGDPLPPTPNEQWCRRIREAAAQGKDYQRIRLLPDPLTPYMKFEIDWCYLYSAEAGEKISVLLPEAPADLRAEAIQDFWMFDDEQVVLLHYDDEGRFSGAEQVDAGKVPAYRALRDRLSEHAIPLREYLARIRRG